MLELLLSDLPINTKAMIVSLRQDNNYHLSKLLGLGLLPGALIQIHQIYPQLIISTGQTLLSLDQEVASLIYVTPSESS